MDKDEKDLNVAWASIDGKGLVRVVPTDSFRSGVAFITELANIAETQQHDPDIQLSHDKVIVTLYSHDVQDVTERDIAFAKAIDALIG